jgi:hypothetical protein
MTTAKQRQYKIEFKILLVKKKEKTKKLTTIKAQKYVLNKL